MSGIMRKAFIFAVLFVFLIHLPVVAIKSATNMALSKTAIGTFGNIKAVTDGVLNASKRTPAESNIVSTSDQYLTIDIGKLVYVDRVKIFWDASAYPDNFSVRTSTNAKYWEDEATGLDASLGALDSKDGVLAVSVSCKRAVIGSRYVQIKVPAGARVSSASDRVKIAEVQVFPAMDQKMSIIDKDAYVVTDKTAVIFYKTSIGATAGKVVYGDDPSALTRVAPNQESGVENSATIYGLDPGKGYYYKVEATDLYGNTIASDLGRFETLATNIAIKKPVTGTFTELPADPFVDSAKPVLPRVTDGSTSYFTAMATSRSIYSDDQYVTIDLGKNYPIKNVQTYWRKLAYPENYSVLVSSDNKDWKVVAEGLNAADGAFSRSDAGDPMQVHSVSAKDVNGRYIKVHIKKGSPFFHKHSNWDFVQLMEVKVFAN